MTSITNTKSWTNVDGRIGMPNFKRQTIIWRGAGEEVHLVGFEKADRKHGKANVDYIDWSNAPQWAIDELHKAGFMLDSEIEFDTDRLPKPEEVPAEGVME